MQHVIIVIHLMLVLAMIGVVLLQRSEGGGLGIGSTGGFMTSRGTANVLTRATAILAGLFFLTSLLLSILAGVGHKPTSILEGGQSAPTAPGYTTPRWPAPWKRPASAPPPAASGSAASHPGDRADAVARGTCYRADCFARGGRHRPGAPSAEECRRC